MAAGDPGSPARYYSSTAVETALGSSIPAQSQGQANTSFIVGSISGFPTDYPYTLIVDPDTSKEEVVTVYAGSSTTLSVYRGADNTQAVAHSAGAVVRHGVSGRDFRESENHIAARGYDIDQTILIAANQTHVHGIATGDGVIVGTLKSQTLTQKTLTTPIINGATVSGAVTSTATVTGGTFTSVTVTSSTISTSTLTGSFTASAATFVSPTISGSPVITGLSSAGMVDSSAAPKNYVDSILGSATSAAISAASAAASATAAATSATSAATSATSAASSASASATSASAAATSATSASNSATAAATSASSASTSASSALTSQTAAATSAASASTSASSALTSATSAATSYDEFDDRYLGAKATPPTVDNDGNALITGALYWNTAVNKMYVWSGTAWGEISSSADIIAYKYTVAGGATSVSGADDNGLTLTYTVGKEQVYINGVLQVRGSDYTATTGSSITGIAAMLASDIVTVLAFTAFSVSNTYTQAEADAKFVQQTTNYFAGKNLVNNGNMNISQRGTSLAGLATGQSPLIDRFYFRNNNLGTATYSQETDAPTGFKTSAKILWTTADATPAASDFSFFRHNMEGQSLQFLNKGSASAKPTTLSFWVKSNVTGTYIVNFTDNDNTRIICGTYTIVSSGVWEKKTITIVGDTSGVLDNDNGNSFTLDFGLGAGSDRNSGTLQTTWGATVLANALVGQVNVSAAINNYWMITGIQWEIGSVASDWQLSTGTIAGELAVCQRYYETNYPAGYKAGDSVVGVNDTQYSLVALNATGSTRGTNRARSAGMAFVVPKRATPTMRVWDRAGNLTRYTAGDADLSSLSNNNAFDAFGTISAMNNTVTFQTVFASSSHYGAFVQWEASAEL